MAEVTANSLVEKKVLKRGDGLRANIQNIHIISDFNARFDTPEYRQAVKDMAEQIALGHQFPPIEVKPMDDGKGVRVIDGHTRTLADKLLYKEGRHPDTDKNGVLMRNIVISKAKTPREEKARIVRTQKTRNLAALELGHLYRDMRAMLNPDGSVPTLDQIAAEVDMTKAHVEQMLLLVNSGEEEKEMVKKGEIASSLAVQMIREHGEQAGAVMKSELAKAKAQGKAKITEATMNAPKVPRHILEEVAAQFGKIVDALTPLDRVALEEFRTGKIGDDEGVIYMPVQFVLAAFLAHDEMKRLQADIDTKQRAKVDKAKQTEADV